jgi:hypothetical protein
MRVVENAYYRALKTARSLRLRVSDRFASPGPDDQVVRKLDRGLTPERALDIWREIRNQVLPPSRVQPLTTALSELGPGCIDRLLADAEEICRHRILILGERVEVGSVIDWHQDFASGRVWPRCFIGDLSIFDGVRGSDIKVPWELSRMHHLVTLGQAFYLSREEKYAQALYSHLSDWLEANPFGRGVNWLNPMEVAIRAVNLIWACGLLCPMGEHAAGLGSRILNLLRLHGEYIYGHLENHKRHRSNHYLANLLGLAYLAFFCPFLAAARKWATFAARELEREVPQQILPDGTDYEGSIPYHGLVTEILLHACYLSHLAERVRPSCPSGEAVGAALRRVKAGVVGPCVVRMAGFVRDYTRPDGLAPQIGDNDSGRILPFDRTTADLNDHRHLLALAGALFGRPELSTAGWPRHQDALWLFGGDVHVMGGGGKPDPRNSVAYSAGGYYLLRQGGDYCLIHCSGLGTGGIGNHSHNDNLSVEVCLERKPFVVDPGTYAYLRSPELRDLFRSTAFHNTVRIDGQEQNDFVPGEPFALRAASQSACLEWEVGASSDVWAGEVEWKATSGEALRHRRTVRLLKSEPGFEFTDEVAGSGRHRLEWCFHLAPGVRVSKPVCDLGSEAAITLTNGDVAVRFAASGFPAGALSVGEGAYSPSYGKKQGAMVLQLCCETTLPFRGSFVLRSMKG